MPRPPRIGGGGRRGIGGGPYRWQNTSGMNPRGLSGAVRSYDRFSGNGYVKVDQYGIPVSARRSGGAAPRKPRPPITQQMGPSPRERVARKIASKIMERETFIGSDRSETRQAAFDAAKNAALTTYQEADHYPSGRDATPEQDRKDREIYLRAYGAARDAFRSALRAA